VKTRGKGLKMLGENPLRPVSGGGGTKKWSTREPGEELDSFVGYSRGVGIIGGKRPDRVHKEKGEVIKKGKLNRKSGRVKGTRANGVGRP